MRKVWFLLPLLGTMLIWTAYHWGNFAFEETEDSAIAFGGVVRPIELTTLGRFAVVRPFWSNEIPELMNSRATSRPCIGDPLPIDLVLYYHGMPSDVHRDFPHTRVSLLLSKFAKRKDIVECFHKVRIEYAMLDEASVYPNAACEQFQSMYRMKPEVLWGYDSIYQMELDVLPIRPGWLEELLPRFAMAARGVVWVTGGGWNYSCIEKFDRSHSPIVLSPFRKGWYNKADGPFLDHHINGNAVYSAAPEFSAMVREWNCSALPFYDWEMWKKGHNSRFTEKWHYDPFFMDCKADGPFKGVYRSIPVVRILEDPAFDHVLLLHRNARMPIDPTKLCKNC